MNEVRTSGLDLAKHVFQAHGVTQRRSWDPCGAAVNHLISRRNICARRGPDRCRSGPREIVNLSTFGAPCNQDRRVPDSISIHKLSTTGLSLFAMVSRFSLTPLVVAKPSWSMLTLIVTGTPASSPSCSPRAIAASTADACASTSTGLWSTTALIRGLTASSRASGRRFLRRDLFRLDQFCQLRRRQAPQSFHVRLSRRGRPCVRHRPSFAFHWKLLVCLSRQPFPVLAFPRDRARRNPVALLMLATADGVVSRARGKSTR